MKSYKLLKLDEAINLIEESNASIYITTFLKDFVDLIDIDGHIVGRVSWETRSKLYDKYENQETLKGNKVCFIICK